MHLLLRDHVPLPSPTQILPDADGARLLAEIYAYDPRRVSVRAMMNATVDGAVTGADGTSGSLRNPTDSYLFDVLRALADVVLVGAATVRAEDYGDIRGRSDLLEPSRRPMGAASPALAVLSRSGNLPASITADPSLLLITDPQHRVRVRETSAVPDHRVIAASTPGEVVEALARRGYRGIQCEGGPSTLGAFAAAGVLTELCLSTTHRTVGGASKRVFDADAHDQPWRAASLIVGQHATLARYVR